MQRIRNLEIAQLARKKGGLRCFGCDKKGHVFKQCPNRFKNLEIVASSSEEKEEIFEITADQFTPDSMVLGTDSGKWNHIWYVSKNSSIHVASTMEVFENFKKLKTENLEENSVVFRGVGEVIVPSNDKNYVIPYVTYMPDIGNNILSLFQLLAQGFIVDFLDEKCVIKRMFENGENMGSSGVSVEEKFEDLEREISIDIARRMLTEYVGNKCDRIGETSNKGLVDEKFDEKMVIPSELQKVIEFVDHVILGKFESKLKEFFEKDFDKMLKWFHKEFLGKPLEKETPPFIVYRPVSLMDMFKEIRSLGGGKDLTVKGEWDILANGLGYPVDYAKNFEDCYKEYLQHLDLYYTVGKKMLVENEKDIVEWNGKRIRLETDTLQGFVNFMEIMKDTQMAARYKKLLKEKIQDLVVWFHRVYMDCLFDYPMPPKIGELEICLFDLFVLVDGLGGGDEVSKNEQWDTVGLSFGFPPWLKHKVQGIYGTYLSMMDSFFRAALEESSKPDPAVTLAGEHDVSEGIHGGRVGVVVTDGKNEDGEDKAQVVHAVEEDFIKVNVLYDDGHTMQVTVDGEEDDSDEEPSITEYCDSDGNLKGDDSGTS